jgi:hypothetical protein
MQTARHRRVTCGRQKNCRRQKQFSGHVTEISGRYQLRSVCIAQAVRSLLLKKPIAASTVKEFPAFNGIQRLIVVFTIFIETKAMQQRLNKLIIAQLSRNSPVFKETYCSLPSSQKPATDLYPEPVESNPHPPFLSILLGGFCPTLLLIPPPPRHRVSTTKPNQLIL